MKVIISNKIKRKEFKKGVSSQDLDIILDSFKKGVFDPIKGNRLITLI